MTSTLIPFLIQRPCKGRDRLCFQKPEQTAFFSGVSGVQRLFCSHHPIYLPSHNLCFLICKMGLMPPHPHG